jgi:uncharacterized membrane protein YukC
MEEIKEILQETQKTLQGNNEELKKIEKKIITDKKYLILGSLSMLILEVVAVAYFMDYL